MKKTCNKCKKEKLIGQFFKNKSRKDGHHDFCMTCDNEYSRKITLKQYNISTEDYEQILKNQDYRCAICGSYTLDSTRKTLAVDHDHASGKVRGLLCVKCNLGVGCMKDSIQVLQNAIDYLKKHK